ncbi:MAG: hypothetical protein ACLR1A_04860 [Eubacterium ventriosum]
MMIGQKNNIQTRIQWRCNKSVPRFIIIAGDEGSGRLTFAKAILKIINAKGIIMGNSIADVRDTIEQAYYITQPTCYIFRDADDMKNEAKNALLKVVEEPPNNAYFIMTVHNIDNMLSTIRSRGTVIKMEPYTMQELRYVSEDELSLEYCNNIGELQIPHEEIQRAEDCVDGVLKALKEKSGTRLLKACTQLKAKQTETDKIDCLLFFKVFQKRLYRMFENFELSFECIQPLFICKQELNRNTINKRASIESMLIRMLEEIKEND